MKAVQFGAGNIGRGFLGQLYYESGYETTYIDVSQDVVNEINRHHEYEIKIVGDHPQTIRVKKVNAILSSDAVAIKEAIISADIMATSVGVAYMADVAKTMAPGIFERLRLGSKPLDILLCENKLQAGPFMRDQVASHLPTDVIGRFDSSIGFVEASIGRMVPLMTPEMRIDDPLLVCVEEYCDLPVDAEAFRGPTPMIKGLMPKKPFSAYVERKLFVHNAGHATTAYLGYLRGHEYIWQAMQDPRVRPIVNAAMKESCSALHRKYHTSLKELLDHAEDLKVRFQNKELGDQVRRVGGDLVRKLGPEDRLIGAIKLCLDQKIEPHGLYLAVAASIRFSPVGDPSADQVQTVLTQTGIKGVLTQISELPPDSPVIDEIERASQSLNLILGIES